MASGLGFIGFFGGSRRLVSGSGWFVCGRGGFVGRSGRHMGGAGGVGFLGSAAGWDINDGGHGGGYGRSGGRLLGRSAAGMKVSK